MTAPFDPPPGDVGSLQSAAKALAKLATDLDAQVVKAKSAVALAKSEWRAPRADDFQSAGQALVDELAMMVTATGNAANILGNYATELQTTATDIATYKTNYDKATAQDGASGGADPLAVARQQSNWVQQALNAKYDLHTYALKTAAALDAETGLALPKSGKLSPAEIARKVDFSLGFTGFDEANFITGKVSDDAAWAMLGLADGPVFDSGVPAPGDSGFQAWYASLTPTQQLLETQKLQQSFNPKGFDPYTTIKGAPLPQWAIRFNDQHQNLCYADGRMGDGYGYFGGGTIEGPGGKQWPIVMPYYSDGHKVYMEDSGQERADGGINQLDGKDPGWHTVSYFANPGTFGSVSTSTKVITAGLIFTGEDLETTETDPGAVEIDANGVPHAGGDVEDAFGPQDKAWWDVDSDTMMPKPQENLPPGSIQPNLEYNQAALGANTLLVQAARSGVAVHNESSHATRQWYVEYQVNDDGRVRAVVHTYSATPGENGKTFVGAFANSFPTGQSGNTEEIPYKSRYNPYSQPVMTAAPDKKVIYSTNTDDVPNDGKPILEKLNK